jgi:hypothetical protein
MHNPSPYDSGYRYSFSTASGPGQPPSSRGNSHIDDQVDKYIRDQRVVTIVLDPSAADAIQTQSPRAPLPPNHIDITRLIDQRHRTFTHHTDRSPPLLPDRDTECALQPWFDMLHEERRDPSCNAPYGHISFDPHNHARQPRTQESPPAPTLSDSDDSTSSPPSLIDASSDEDEPYDRITEISDDARNAIHRRYAHMQTRRHPLFSNPPRLTAAGHTVFDIRVHSDSTPIYRDPSDSSDGDTPHYWPETTNLTPPASNSPPPVMITDRQLMEWIESQLPWNIFCQTIPIFRDTPIELCGKPRLQRDLPNRTFMYEQAAPYHNKLDSFNRISAFLHSGLSWSNHPKILPQHAAYPQQLPRNIPQSTLHDL